MKLELDSLLWKDQESISIKKLWDYLTTYCYLPRIKSYDVLEDAILRGVDSSEFFAYAANVADGRFIDLKYNKHISFIDKSGYLVKTDSARKQILDDQSKVQKEVSQPVTLPVDHTDTSRVESNMHIGEVEKSGFGGAYTTESSSVEQNNLQHNFFMSANIDNTRIIRDVQKYVEEVISHLIDANGSSVEITLEVKATSESGFTQPTVRAVSENCRTLKIDNFGFDS